MDQIKSADAVVEEKENDRQALALHAMPLRLAVDLPEAGHDSLEPAPMQIILSNPLHRVAGKPPSAPRDHR